MESSQQSLVYSKEGKNEEEEEKKNTFLGIQNLLRHISHHTIHKFFKYLD